MGHFMNSLNYSSLPLEGEGAMGHFMNSLKLFFPPPSRGRLGGGWGNYL
jgi:hypothetical protein